MQTCMLELVSLDLSFLGTKTKKGTQWVMNFTACLKPNLVLLCLHAKYRRPLLGVFLHLGLVNLIPAWWIVFETRMEGSPLVSLWGSCPVCKHNAHSFHESPQRGQLCEKGQREKDSFSMAVSHEGLSAVVTDARVTPKKTLEKLKEARVFNIFFAVDIIPLSAFRKL